MTLRQALEGPHCWRCLLCPLGLSIQGRYTPELLQESLCKEEPTFQDLPGPSSPFQPLPDPSRLHQPLPDLSRPFQQGQ